MSRSDGGPPSVAAWLLERAAPRRAREAVLGDMAEEFERRSEAGMPARGWYWREALRGVLAFGWSRAGRSRPMRATGVALFGLVAMQLWLMALNSRPAVAAVASLGGRGEAFAAAVLELSAFLVGGLVVGRFAGNARLPGGILLVVVALSIPILVGRATGASSVWPTPWWVVLASGGVTAGAALAARLPGRAGPRAPRPT